MRQGDDRAGPTGLIEWFRFGERDRVDEAIDQLAAVGCTHLRTHVSWADYHRPGGAEWYAFLLPRLAARFDLLPTVHYTPPSLSETGTTAGPPRDPKAFADFIDVLIDRHGDCFDTIELWNEPNNLLDWDWRVDTDWLKFGKMAGGAAHWARTRAKRVVLGGPCPTDLNWFDIMGRHGVLGVVDVVGIHGFPGTWESEEALWQGWEAVIASVKETCAPWNEALDVWITETGYSTWRHDEAGQLTRYLDATAAPAGRVYWYGLKDLPDDVPSQEGLRFDERHYHCGIFHAGGRPKLLARALSMGGRAEVARLAALARRPPAVIGTKPVLVTGGAGFVGSNLADRLAAEGEPVLVLDSLARPGVEENLAWLKARHGKRLAVSLSDLRDRESVADAVADASAVFHLAGQVAVTDSLLDPETDFDVNLAGTLNLLKALRTRPDPVPLVFASTNKVYGDLADVAVVHGPKGWRPADAAIATAGIGEDRPLAFHTPYGCSKGAADQYVLDHAASFGRPACVMRMSCVYGPRQHGTEDQGWVAHFARSALAGRPVTLYGDGEQVRDILHVSDAVAAYLAAWRTMGVASGRAFNLGGGPANAVSLNRVLAALEETVGRPVERRFGPWRPGDQRWYVSDTRAVTAALGLPEPLGWRHGLLSLVDWLKPARRAAPSAARPAGRSPSTLRTAEVR